jgi:hypothetical protein
MKSVNSPYTPEAPHGTERERREFLSVEHEDPNVGVVSCQVLFPTALRACGRKMKPRDVQMNCHLETDEDREHLLADPATRHNICKALVPLLMAALLVVR